MAYPRIFPSWWKGGPLEGKSKRQSKRLVYINVFAQATQIFRGAGRSRGLELRQAYTTLSQHTHPRNTSKESRANGYASVKYYYRYPAEITCASTKILD